MSQEITTQGVQQAAAELAKMRRSLAQWLRYRTLNDQVMAGTARVRKPLPYAQRVVAASRDPRVEQDLATKLAALLSQVMPNQALPTADLTVNPQGAVQLAQLALQGGTAVTHPTAVGALGGGPPWLWPVVIAGGVLLLLTSVIASVADVAKDREEKACIEAGACTDYGFWLKAAAVVTLGWFAWEKAGLKHHFNKGRS